MNPPGHINFGISVSPFNPHSNPFFVPTEAIASCPELHRVQEGYKTSEKPYHGTFAIAVSVSQKKILSILDELLKLLNAKISLNVLYEDQDHGLCTALNSEHNPWEATILRSIVMRYDQCLLHHGHISFCFQSNQNIRILFLPCKSFEIVVCSLQQQRSFIRLLRQRDLEYIPNLKPLDRLSHSRRATMKAQKEFNKLSQDLYLQPYT